MQDMVFMHSVTQAIIRMLIQSPLYKPKPPKGSKPKHGRILNRELRAVHNSGKGALLGPSTNNFRLHAQEADGSRNQLAAPHHFTWPTPCDAAWSDIQAVASRVMITLQWLSRHVLDMPVASLTPEEAKKLAMLRRDLILVLHQLIAGHLLDADLDMATVFDLGLELVAAQLIHNEMGLLAWTDLGMAFLRRLAMDTSLVPSRRDDTDARWQQRIEGIWAVWWEFCEFLAAHTTHAAGSAVTALQLMTCMSSCLCDPAPSACTSAVLLQLCRHAC